MTNLDASAPFDRLRAGPQREMKLFDIAHKKTKEGRSRGRGASLWKSNRGSVIALDKSDSAVAQVPGFSGKGGFGVEEREPSGKQFSDRPQNPKASRGRGRDAGALKAGRAGCAGSRYLKRKSEIKRQARSRKGRLFGKRARRMPANVPRISVADPSSVGDRKW